MKIENTNVIRDYFVSQQRRLKEDFDRIRASLSDSDVKGSANEQTIVEFLNKHISAHFITSNVQIIDSYGKSSDEVDVCVCNVDQPFGASPGQLVIVEGVDFVVQVKARLTSTELERIVRNAQRVKQLKRMAAENDSVHSNIDDVPYYVDRIPYFVLAYTSELTLEKTHEKLTALLSAVPLELQPDAIFVLDRGAILNMREGKGKAWKAGGKPIIGLCVAHSGEQTLFEFMYYMYLVVPRFYRVVNPLAHYFPSTRDYKISGRVT
jgi:hypothetical protein